VRRRTAAVCSTSSIAKLLRHVARLALPLRNFPREASYPLLRAVKRHDGLAAALGLYFEPDDVFVGHLT
jgi:hypothetical protein